MAVSLKEEQPIHLTEQGVIAKMDSGYLKFVSGQLTPQDKQAFNTCAERMRSDPAIPDSVKNQYGRFLDLITADEKALRPSSEKTKQFAGAFFKDWASSATIFGVPEEGEKLWTLQKKIEKGEIPFAQALPTMMWLSCRASFKQMGVDADVVGLVGTAAKTGIVNWCGEVRDSYRNGGVLSAAYDVISTPGMWIDTFFYGLATKPFETIKSLIPVGTGEMTYNAFRMTYNNPTEDAMTYLRLTMYVFTLDCAASFCALKPLKPLVAAAKTALVQAFREGLTSDAMASAKEKILEIGGQFQKSLANQRGGMVIELSKDEFEMFVRRPVEIIKGMKLDPPVEEAALKNITDREWITTVDRKSLEMLKGRLQTLKKMNELFRSAAEELGWDKKVAERYADEFMSLLDVSERAPYTTYGHTLRTSQYTEVMLKDMDIPAREKAKIRLAALIHDVGKIGVDNELWRKPGAYTEAEKKITATHVNHTLTIAQRLYEKIGGVGRKEFNDIANTAAYHHEYFDGTTHFGLKGERIPLGSRIIGLTDTYDAMASDRSYRSSLPDGICIAAIRKGEGTQFDPSLAEKFIGQVVERKK